MVLPFADILKTFGAHGELLIRLCPEAPKEINVSEPVFIKIDGYAVPFYYKRFETRGKHRALVVFDDMETEMLAQELVGKTIMAHGKGRAVKDEAPAAGTSVLAYEVIDENSGQIGTVSGFFDIPGNPCLQIQRSEQEMLIPFHEALVITVDHKRKIITTNLPDGLVNINPQ
jgi:16S rRNA processing protein RimM